MFSVTDVNIFMKSNKKETNIYIDIAIKKHFKKNKIAI